MRRARRCVGAIALGRIGFSVTRCTEEARGPVPVGAPHHTHGVRQPGVELQRGVAGNVAVLTARVLEYPLYGGESCDGLVYVTQVTAIGPLGLEYLNPGDDPRELGHDQEGTD